MSSACAGLVPHAFAVTCVAALVAAAVGPAYDARIADARTDDDLAGGPEDALGRVANLPLEEVLHVLPLAGPVLGHYLVFDFLARFTWGDVTRCRIVGGEITLFGSC